MLKHVNASPCTLFQLRGGSIGGRMDAFGLRRLSRQCRELMPRARSEIAREQLCLWANEFEEQAQRIELEEVTADVIGRWLSR